MNEKRRRKLREIIARIEALKSATEDARNMLKDEDEGNVGSALREISEEQNEAVSNLSARSLDGERGSKMQEAANDLEAASENLDEVVEHVGDIEQALDNAIENIKSAIGECS